MIKQSPRKKRSSLESLALPFDGLRGQPHRQAGAGASCVLCHWEASWKRSGRQSGALMGRMTEKRGLTGPLCGPHGAFLGQSPQQTLQGPGSDAIT